MTEEASADSGGFDIEAAADTIGNNLFPPEETPTEDEEYDVVEEIIEEVEEEPEETPEEKPDEEQEESEETVQEEVAAKEAPQSWKKEMREHFSQLTPEVQDYIVQREEQMRDGLEKDRNDANLGRTMRDVMSPYSEMLRQQGIDEGVMVRNLLNAHFTLSTADPNKKLELIKQISREYGVPLDGEQPQQEIDPAIQTLQAKINGLEQILTTSQMQARQAAEAQVNREVSEFAESHEFFDEVSEQIVPLIKMGYSLEEAYQSAIWVNPVTRQKEIDRQTKDAAEKAQSKLKEEAEKARKAKVVNVRGRDTKKTPTEPLGTMEDTIRETLREIKNRSH